MLVIATALHYIYRYFHIIFICYGGTELWTVVLMSCRGIKCWLWLLNTSHLQRHQATCCYSHIHIYICVLQMRQTADCSLPQTAPSQRHSRGRLAVGRWHLNTSPPSVWRVGRESWKLCLCQGTWKLCLCQGTWKLCLCQGTWKLCLCQGTSKLCLCQGTWKLCLCQGTSKLCLCQGTWKLCLCQGTWKLCLCQGT